MAGESVATKYKWYTDPSANKVVLEDMVKPNSKKLKQQQSPNRWAFFLKCTVYKIGIWNNWEGLLTSTNVTKLNQL